MRSGGSSETVRRWDQYEDDEYANVTQNEHFKARMAQAVLQQLATVTLERDANDLLHQDAQNPSHPSHPHRPHDSYDDNATSAECLVCLAPYRHKDIVVSLSCGHSYHGPCLYEWLIRHCHCPYCRHDLQAEYSHKRESRCPNTAASGTAMATPGPVSLSWRLAKVLPHQSSNHVELSPVHDQPHVPGDQQLPLQQQERRKSLLAHVLQQKQDSLNYEWHQRTVLQQLSFSPPVAAMGVAFRPEEM
jgi:hypothetical protein